ncbi:hypothetical protein C8R43DRAFT_879620, partial [Mycena crocata]
KREEECEKKQHERDLACVLKRREQERKKAAAADSDNEGDKPNANTVLMQGADTLASGSNTISDVAALSCTASTQKWRKQRTGTLGGTVKMMAIKVFWFTPFLWAIIEPTICRCGWSAA